VLKIYWFYLLISLLLANSPSVLAESKKQNVTNSKPSETRIFYPPKNKLPTEKEKTTPEVVKPTKSESIFTSILNTIVNTFARQEVPLGSRTNTCAITPGLVGKEDLIWNNRPVFAWKGNARQIVLRDYDTGVVLWEKLIADGQQYVVYTGESLTPGRIYRWKLISETNSSVEFTFELMSSLAREKIFQELQALETSLQEQGESLSNISLARSNYFFERNLWSDAIETLYAIDNPSPEIVAALTNISHHFCQAKTFPKNEKIARNFKI
jgi:hypothetical protein